MAMVAARRHRTGVGSARPERRNQKDRMQRRAQVPMRDKTAMPSSVMVESGAFTVREITTRPLLWPSHAAMGRTAAVRRFRRRRDRNRDRIARGKRPAVRT